MNIEEIGFYKVAEFILREPPARDECFKVVSRDADAHEYGDFSEVARREMIHRHMANEMTSVDMAAVCVVEFPADSWYDTPTSHFEPLLLLRERSTTFTGSCPSGRSTVCRSGLRSMAG